MTMKAKTYYIHPATLDGCARNQEWADRQRGVVKVKVIKSSDIDKLVEKAARSLAESVEGPWRRLPKVAQDSYREWTRAQFKSIGLLP